ncbi:hypothetical protein MRX96_008412 [Rhipicephalus microplus]
MGLGQSKVDQATGMTEREKQLVLASWNAFTKDRDDYGVQLFDALFVAHPEYLKLFHKFKGETIEEVRKESKFREHGVTIGMQLSNLIEFLDDPDNLNYAGEKQRRAPHQDQGRQAEALQGLQPSHHRRSQDQSQEADATRGRAGLG